MTMAFFQTNDGVSIHYEAEAFNRAVMEFIG